MPVARTGRDLSEHRPKDETDKPDYVFLKIKSISEIIGVFKTTTSKLVRMAGLVDFAWQRSFHDHIIRHEKAYIKIKDYILSNPEKWPEDLFYKEG